MSLWSWSALEYEMIRGEQGVIDMKMFVKSYRSRIVRNAVTEREQTRPGRRRSHGSLQGHSFGEDLVAN